MVVLRAVAKDILHLNFNSQYDLTSTFLRFQEHYESPKFADQIFTIEEFKEWYIGAEGSGLERNDGSSFTYYEDWEGFNIPSYVLQPFYQGKFDPLSDKERQFLELFREIRHDKFYVIGTYGDDEQILMHEIAHGMYYTVPEYKDEVLEALKGLKKETATKISDMLASAYHEKSIIDETHAYTLEGIDYLADHDITGDDLDDVSKKLNSIYAKYFEKVKIQCHVRQEEVCQSPGV